MKKKVFSGLLAAAAMVLGTMSPAHADDQAVTFVGGVASFHSLGTVLSGGDDIATIGGLAPGMYDVALTWSGQYIIPDMMKTNLNGVLGTQFGSANFVFIGIEATSPPDFVFELFGTTTNLLATWSAEVTAIRVSDVPEPATPTMILAGLGVVFLVSRRQGSRSRTEPAFTAIR